MACFVSSQNEFSVGVDLLEVINQSLPALQLPLVLFRCCCWFCCDGGGCIGGEDGAQITILLLALLLAGVAAVTAEAPPAANGPITCTVLLLLVVAPALDCFRYLATCGGRAAGAAGVMIVTASNSASPAWDDKLLGAPAEQQKNPVTKPEK